MEYVGCWGHAGFWTSTVAQGPGKNNGVLRSTIPCNYTRTSGYIIFSYQFFRLLLYDFRRFSPNMLLHNTGFLHYWK